MPLKNIPWYIHWTTNLCSMNERMNGFRMKEEEKTTRFRKDTRSLKKAPLSFLIPTGALFQSSLQQEKMHGGTWATGAWRVATGGCAPWAHHTYRRKGLRLSGGPCSVLAAWWSSLSSSPHSPAILLLDRGYNRSRRPLFLDIYQQIPC